MITRQNVRIKVKIWYCHSFSRRLQNVKSTFSFIVYVVTFIFNKNSTHTYTQIHVEVEKNDTNSTFQYLFENLIVNF